MLRKVTCEVTSQDLDKMTRPLELNHVTWVGCRVRTISKQGKKRCHRLPALNTLWFVCSSKASYFPPSLKQRDHLRGSEASTLAQDLKILQSSTQLQDANKTDSTADRQEKVAA